MTVSNTDDLDQIIADNDSTTDLDAGLGGGSSSNPFALPGSNPSGQMLPGYVPATVQKLRNEADIAQVTPDEISGRNADRFGGAAGKVFAGLMQQAATSASAKNKPDFSYATQGIDDAQKAEDADLAERQGYAKQLLAQADSQQKRADTVSMGMAKLASLKDIAQGKRETTGRLIDVKKQLADNQTAALAQGKWAPVQFDGADGHHVGAINTATGEHTDRVLAGLAPKAAGSANGGTWKPVVAGDLSKGYWNPITNEVRIPPGQDRNITLADGTTVGINKGQDKALKDTYKDIMEKDKDIAPVLANTHLVNTASGSLDKKTNAGDKLAIDALGKLAQGAGRLSNLQVDLLSNEPGLIENIQTWLSKKSTNTMSDGQRQRLKEIANMMQDEIDQTRGRALTQAKQRLRTYNIPDEAFDDQFNFGGKPATQLMSPTTNNSHGKPAAASTTSPVGGGQQQARPPTFNREQAKAAQEGSVFMYNGHTVRKRGDGGVDIIQ